MYDNHDLEFQRTIGGTTLQTHIVHTYMWMMAGVLVSFVSAFLLVQTGMLFTLFSIPFFSTVLLIVQLVVAVMFGARLHKLSTVTAKILFFTYAALLGITLSTLAFAYDLGSISIAFLVSLIYFGSLIVIGTRTKMNLLRFGPLLFGALLTFFIASVVMMLFNIDTNTMVMSFIGLLIFTGLCAYDAQKVKALYFQFEHDETMLKKISIYSAFELYLDFINIFLYILRMLGNRD